ncbi:MAG TPA: glutathionylspermidine synthase family protein [Rhizomicrobium sp.]|jgi:glutathionylspermidine synthase
MKRLPIQPRADWQRKVERFGLLWHSPDGALYWNESAYYQVSPREQREIADATEECYRLFLAAGQRVIDDRLYERFGIPGWAVPMIEAAWEEEPPALNYGRFDFGCDGQHPPKLFEFNCDTPTSLLEAAVIQGHWLQDQFPHGRQFNDIHDLLVDKWRDIIPYLPAGRVYFMSAGGDALGEDMMTATYLRETADEAGLVTDSIMAPDVGWDSARDRFVDLQNHEIGTLYKLYPWEWLVKEPFGKCIPDAPTIWIEPAWKMLWSNKMILPVLWEMFPGHPNLLETAMTPLGRPAVAKPVLGREGRGVSFVDGNAQPDNDPRLGPMVFQSRFDIPEQDGKTPIVGSWIVDGKAAGIGIREGGRITDNSSSFVPHIVAE